MRLNSAASGQTRKEHREWTTMPDCPKLRNQSSFYTCIQTTTTVSLSLNLRIASRFSARLLIRSKSPHNLVRVAYLAATLVDRTAKKLRVPRDNYMCPSLSRRCSS